MRGLVIRKRDCKIIYTDLERPDINDFVIVMIEGHYGAFEKWGFESEIFSI